MVVTSWKVTFGADPTSALELFTGFSVRLHTMHRKGTWPLFWSDDIDCANGYTMGNRFTIANIL